MSDPVYITFEFRGDLDKEVEKVSLGIKGLREESAKTYQRLIADSSTAYNALSADNRRDVEDINERYLNGLSFHYVDTALEAINFSLLAAEA